MALTKMEKEKLDETHDIALEIKTVLLGTNGDAGLCGDVYSMKKDYYKFKGRVVLVFGILIGTGAIAGSVVGIIQAVL